MVTTGTGSPLRSGMVSWPASQAAAVPRYRKSRLRVVALHERCGTTVCSTRARTSPEARVRRRVNQRIVDSSRNSSS